MSDIAIKADRLGKSYLITRAGVQTERYYALRDVLVNRSIAFGRKAIDVLMRGSDAASPSLEEIWALRNVSFEVKQGERIGIVGRNGAGKSTLLKILSRITEPTEGRVEMTGRVASLLEVGTGFHPELTGRENIFLNGAILGMTRAEVRRKFDEIVEFAEIQAFLDTPVKRYSSGMYVRLAFAVAAHLEPEILIVDEVLAVGDAQFQRKCLGKMEDVGRAGRTVIFVSHDMGLVKNLCGSCLLLDKGVPIAFSNTSEVVELYESRTSGLASASNLPDGYLYAAEQHESSQFYVSELYITDEAGQLVRSPKSLDSIVINVLFHSPKRQKNGSVALFIKTLDGTVVLRYATRPDSNLELDFEAGSNLVRCHIKHLPLPPGPYVIGAGLAIPMREWLCLTDELCLLDVGFRDVHGSGFVPQQAHAKALSEYGWSK